LTGTASSSGRRSPTAEERRSLELRAGRIDLAARLLGQVDRIVDETQLTFEQYAESVRRDVERRDVERQLREQLGNEPILSLLAEGRSLSIEDAVAEALRA